MYEKLYTLRINLSTALDTYIGSQKYLRTRGSRQFDSNGNPESFDNYFSMQVVWRGPSESFLTIGTISFDKRFSVSTPYANEWNLHIRNLKRSDEGEYECIANTKPRQYKRVMLVVKGSYSILQKIIFDHHKIQI